MFALWYLISKPRNKAIITSPEFVFGYRKSYSGVGVFLYKQGNEMRLQAKQDYDTGPIDLQKLSEKYVEGETGCTLDFNLLKREVSSDTLTTGIAVSLIVRD